MPAVVEPRRLATTRALLHDDVTFVYRRSSPAAGGPTRGPVDAPGNYVPPVSDEPWDWLDAIEATITDGTFTLVTQPIVDLARGTVVGYEALTRFGGTAPSPTHWFAVADRLGLGAELSARVLRRQLDLREHLPRGRFLAINISPLQLATTPVQQALAAPSLAGLVLELTDHGQVHDLPALRSRIDALRDRGARIALDDAGAGYAGLQALLELEPDVVKFDRSLVDNVQHDEAKRALIASTAAVLRGLDTWLVAEGIESALELEVLARLGVPLGQGYLLGPPAPGWPRPDASVLALARDLTRRASRSR